MDMGIDEARHDQMRAMVDDLGILSPAAPAAGSAPAGRHRSFDDERHRPRGSDAPPARNLRIVDEPERRAAQGAQDGRCGHDEQPGANSHQHLHQIKASGQARNMPNAYGLGLRAERAECVTGCAAFLGDAPIEIERCELTLTVLDWLRFGKRNDRTKEGCAEGDCGAPPSSSAGSTGGRLR